MYIAAIMASKIDFLQIDLIRYFGGENGTGLFGLSTTGTAFFIWIMILMVYVYIASTLPVWKLLQLRDFFNSHLLVVGLCIYYLRIHRLLHQQHMLLVMYLGFRYYLSRLHVEQFQVFTDLYRRELHRNN